MNVNNVDHRITVQLAVERFHIGRHRITLVGLSILFVFCWVTQQKINFNEADLTAG